MTNIPHEFTKKYVLLLKMFFFFPYISIAAEFSLLLQSCAVYSPRRPRGSWWD